ncbi:TPA: nuclear transport factor 2 family protein [Klebsiella oxytoca]
MNSSIENNLSLSLLSEKIEKVIDIHKLSNLQGRYIYYLQSHDYDSIISLFSSDSDVTVEMDDLGYFVGREKVVDVFLKVLKPLYTTTGAMALHMITTPVIEIEDDGLHAWGMFHSFGCNTQPDFVAQGEPAQSAPELLAMWQQGKYFVEYIKEGEEWKILKFRWYTNFRTSFDKGWVKQPVVGNLSVVSEIFEGCPEPDGPSQYEPFNPDGLNSYYPVPPKNVVDNK